MEFVGASEIMMISSLFTLAQALPASESRDAMVGIYLILKSFSPQNNKLYSWCVQG